MSSSQEPLFFIYLPSIFSPVIMKSELNFQELPNSLKMTFHGFIDS